MKKIRYIALLLSLAIAATALSASAATKQFTLAFDENDFRFSTNEYGELVIQPADPMATMPAGGLPALPQFSTVIAVGERQTYKSHEISVSKRLVRSGIVMEPAQFAVPTDSIFAGAKFERVFPDYDLAQYPADNCEYAATTSHWAGGVSTLHFLSCPFVYNPEGGELYFIDSMTLTVELDETPAPARAASSSAVPHETPWFVHDMVINPADIPAGPQRAAAAADPTGYVDPNRIDYVIITTTQLKSHFEPLATWKKAKGVPTKIITVEEIDRKYEGKDQQLRIKKCLKDLYDNNGLKYALLGGDDTEVPVRGCYAKYSSREDKAIPCDLYYACFGGNFEWNADGDKYYGEVEDNVDFSPSIAVTRLPVRDGATHVAQYIAKLCEYENPTQPNLHYPEMLMGGSSMGIMETISSPDKLASDAQLCGDYLYEKFIQPYRKISVTKLYDTYSDIEGITITPENLKSELAKGYDFAEVLTHGLPNAWVFGLDENTSTLYSTSMAKSQTNNSPSIITTIACLTNGFDSNATLDECLSEAFIRNKNNGVVAYLGASRVNWGHNLHASQWTAVKYNGAYYKTLFSNSIDNNHFGEVVAAAKASLISQSGSQTTERWVQLCLNPIGDPEMPIYTRQANTFGWANVSLSNDTLYVRTKVANCDICVMSLDDNGESYYKIFKNVDEVKLADFPQNTSIVITKGTEYYPIQLIVRHIQNQTMRSKNIRGAIVKIGSSVYPRSAKGDVVIEKGKVKVQAGKIIIGHGFKTGEDVTLTLDNGINFLYFPNFPN